MNSVNVISLLVMAFCIATYFLPESDYLSYSSTLANSDSPLSPLYHGKHVCKFAGKVMLQLLLARCNIWRIEMPTLLKNLKKPTVKIPSHGTRMSIERKFLLVCDSYEELGTILITIVVQCTCICCMFITSHSVWMLTTLDQVFSKLFVSHQELWNHL